MSRTLVALALALLAGCGGGRAVPRQPADEPAPIADAGVDAGPDLALLTQIADGLAEILGTMATVTTDAPDCPTMATQLDELFDHAQQLFNLAEAQAADPDAARLLTAAMDARAADVKPLVDRIVAGLARCQHDPEVAEAMARMPTF